MNDRDATSDDFAECERLEREHLTRKERAILRRKRPRWDLDPPQRESYTSPLGYVLGLQRYARRVIEAEVP